MLFGSQIPDLIRRTIQGAATSADRARKEDTAKRLDFYHDLQLDHLGTVLAQLYADPDKLPATCLNIVKKIVNRRAMTYAEPASRALEAPKKDQDLFAEISKEAGLDLVLKQASRLTKLCKTILLRPVWRNGRLAIDVLTGNVLDVEIGDSPEDLRAVLVTHYGPNDRVEEITYSLWTPETFQRLDYRGRVLEEEPNPYGVLPFIPCWDSLPSEGFWLDGGGDLVNLQESINQALTALLYTCQMQGFGVGFVKGSGMGGSLQTGPGSMVELPENGELGFASTKAPIEEILQVLDSLIKWAAVSNGLPASSLSTDPTEESGVSKLVDNAELQEMRRDDVALWRRYEHQLFDLIRIVWNVHNPGRKLSENATLKIDFGDPKQVTSEKDQAETWLALEELGVISPVDVVLERNPDLQTRKNALAYLLQLQDERSQLDEQKL